MRKALSAHQAHYIDITAHLATSVAASRTEPGACESLSRKLMWFMSVRSLAHAV